MQDWKSLNDVLVTQESKIDWTMIISWIYANNFSKQHLHFLHSGAFKIE